jgi:hypothetical protein
MSFNLQPKPQRSSDKVVVTETTKTPEVQLQPAPERRYRVEELTTQGWELADHNTVNLSREDANRTLQNLLNDGLSPDRIRAVIDDGTKI